MKKTLMMAAILLSLPALPLHAEFELDVSGGFHQMAPSGDLKYRGTSTLNAKDNLGYDKINVFTGRVRAEFPVPFVPNVIIEATPMTYEGTGLMSTPFSFGDTTFNANVPFTSTLQLDHYDLVLYYNLPFVRSLTKKKANVWLGLDTRTFNFKSEINQSAAGKLESKSLTVPVPMAFLGLQLKPIKRVSLDGELFTMAYGNNRYVDISGRIQVNVFKFVYAAAGYKSQNFKIDQDDYKGEFTFAGPIVQVGVSF